MKKTLLAALTTGALLLGGCVGQPAQEECVSAKNRDVLNKSVLYLNMYNDYMQSGNVDTTGFYSHVESAVDMTGEIQYMVNETSLDEAMRSEVIDWGMEVLDGFNELNEIMIGNSNTSGENASRTMLLLEQEGYDLIAKHYCEGE